MVPEAVFIIGGGPSLRGFNWAGLGQKKVIAVNQAIFSVPQTSGLIQFMTMDYSWLFKSHVNDTYTQAYRRFSSPDILKWFVLGHSAPRIQPMSERKTYLDTITGAVYDLRIFDAVVSVYGYGGLGADFTDFRCGSDSGYSAIQLAVAQGFKTIYLLGLDFYVEVDGLHTHYHQDYHASIPVFQKKLEEYLIPYPDMFQRAAELGVKIVSCSAKSKLNQWISYQPVLEVL